MRYLTLTRNKSFVGCLGKAKVYIEDHYAPELTISGTPCRKLGELKNGQQQTFPVGEEALKLFVIADKLTKDYCNEYYQLPPGQEPIALSGGFKFDLGRGNAFRFDGNDSAEILAHRKKNARTGWIVLVVALLVGFALGYVLTSGLLDSPAKDKTFQADQMQVTLTDEFHPLSEEGLTACYNTDDVLFTALKEPFTLAAGLEDYTLEEYGQLVLEVNGVDASLQHTADGLTYFEYDGTVSGEDMHYTAFIYRSDDAFWLIHFVTEDSLQSDYRQQIFDWAATVRFDS